MKTIEKLKHFIDPIMQEAVGSRVFPGAVLLVSRKEKILWHRPYGVTNIYSRLPVTLETVFDLASLTKPLATALAVMKLAGDGRLELEQPLGSIPWDFKNSDKSNTTLTHLLTHSSGLPDYRPYYRELGGYCSEDAARKIQKFIVEEPLVYPPGAKELYSDLGFMILGWVVEKIAGLALDKYVEKQIFEPAGINNLFFRRNNSRSRVHEFAATEKCPWRETILQGQVHDENAFVLGGVAGHAGLFGTALEIFRLLDYLCAIHLGNFQDPVIKKNLVFRLFSRYEKTDRTFGFDTPSKINSSAGRYFSDNSVGHLGFTGTSFWMDLDRRIQVILLTNRVHPTRQNERIKIFRPRLHDRIMRILVTEND